VPENERDNRDKVRVIRARPERDAIPGECFASLLNDLRMTLQCSHSFMWLYASRLSHPRLDFATSREGGRLTGAENDMPPVEVRRGNGRDKELRAVCAGSRIGHRQEAGACVLALEVLVLKLRTCVVGE